MLRRALTIAVFLASFVALGQAAIAGNAFLAHLLGHLYRKGESFACFSREYAPAHLASHPDQQVTFIKALIAAHFAQLVICGRHFLKASTDSHSPC